MLVNKASACSAALECALGVGWKLSENRYVCHQSVEGLPEVADSAVAVQVAKV